MLKISDVKNLYEKYNVSASKRFGQNFLIDQNILKNILKVANVKDKDVIEIGPGLGSLTLYLLEEVNSLVSYEIDEDMIRVLKGEINNDKFTLMEGDFLKADLSTINSKKTIVANIPYNITSDILFKIFENSQKFDRAILMVQKEVGERITSKVGTKNYGKLAVTSNYFANVNYEFTVPNSAFLPAPKVQSAIISLDFKDVNFNDSKDFIKFVKNCFAMRRKTLINNLKNIMDKEKAQSLINKLNFKESIIPQELTLEDFINLYDISL